MTASEFIRKVNFMVNVGTDFDYKKAYKTLSPLDKATVDEYLKTTVFTITN